MIYAISILASPIPKTQPIGLTGKLIEYIQVGQLVMAVIKDVDMELLKSSGEEILIQAVLDHDRLIYELFREQTLLPLRFGTVFKSQAGLEAYLQSEQEQLLSKLQKLKGYAEYLLTMTAIVRESQTPKSQLESTQNLKGKDYLLAKRTKFFAEQTKRSQQQQECEALISILPVQHQVTTPQSGEFLRVYFLANSLQITELQILISKWQLQHSHWQLELSKPLPPYHFCD
ncbi:Gas vesicle synthesis protein GvpL/GvpF [Synechococcus sp. PCC 7502]|uniref:GvpL/GvpF family gas vesicle protein n=1 Tax=Synechococcus sp. PCC 7502 TaxID=1173263 RepID=UPI00029FEE98|nr:GvpL/GvpF family gas vesicle protein [Synechococcus sp. PCC 7502]AFY72716.1 Gas vesicle synthesis protein GvpL/GvpF [Synechococcus sp. PCC 7502]